MYRATAEKVKTVTAARSQSIIFLSNAPSTRDMPGIQLDDAQKSIILNHANRLLGARQHPKTICPSEIARAFSAQELQSLGAAEWRETMDIVRQVVWEKRQAGEVEVMQKGEVVGVESLEEIRGPIRLRMVKK
ncbi:hypothetical protein HBI54_176630 [Parastagonospora nodorum]|nr:hypothetical protein HBI54_176630 [Parastagonospora nodorum]